jgi:hypothetical protein
LNSAIVIVFSVAISRPPPPASAVVALASDCVWRADEAGCGYATTGHRKDQRGQMINLFRLFRLSFGAAIEVAVRCLESYLTSSQQAMGKSLSKFALFDAAHGSACTHRSGFAKSGNVGQIYASS